MIDVFVLHCNAYNMYCNKTLKELPLFDVIFTCFKTDLQNPCKTIKRLNLLESLYMDLFHVEVTINNWYWFSTMFILTKIFNFKCLSDVPEICQNTVFYYF